MAKPKSAGKQHCELSDTGAQSLQAPPKVTHPTSTKFTPIHFYQLLTLLNPPPPPPAQIKA